jgi:hypothetical protein
LIAAKFLEADAGFFATGLPTRTVAGSGFFCFDSKIEIRSEIGLLLD